MTGAALVFVLCMACSGTNASSTVTNRVHPAPVGDLAQRADEAWQSEAGLDYHWPSETPRTAKSYSLQLQACRAGIQRSCWIAMMLAQPDEWDVAAALVRANCRNGHALSCRALPSDADEAGDLEAREYCLHDCDEHLIAQWMDGCRQGLYIECAALRLYGPRRLVKGFVYEHELFAAREMCKLSVVGCDYLESVQRNLGDDLGARDALETNCQRRGICDFLVDAYRGGHIPEPYPGRMEELRVWTCKHDRWLARTTLCGGTIERSSP